MPIYEYACLECEHEFEKIQKMSDSPVRKCPSCGRLKARRKISRTSFVLKGDGWYVTDYPSKDRKAALKSESDNGKPAKDSSGSGGESAKASAETKGKSESKDQSKSGSSSKESPKKKASKPAKKSD